MRQRPAIRRLLRPSLLKLCLLAMLALPAAACDTATPTVPPGTEPVDETPTEDTPAVPSPTANGGETPVEQHGALTVVGSELLDEQGDPVQLRGASSMWLNWEGNGYAESLDALVWMRDHWNLSVIRAAMGVAPDGAYLSDPARAKAQVHRIVENAITAGVYVIVDWHDHQAHEHQAEAEAFFSEIAELYGEFPNLIYEPFNEPEQVSWTEVVKPYHEAVVSKIREKDADNVVILGTPNWSQYVDEAARDPLPGQNLMYTLHFYACTHTAWLRDRANTALSLGAPLFVTEWGGTHADGGLDGVVCLDEAELWTDWMSQHSISWTAWKLDNCSDSSCYFTPAPPPVDGAWQEEHLQGHGPFVVERMRDY